MKQSAIYIALISTLLSNPGHAGYVVDDEYSLQQAIMAANTDASISKIKFRKNAKITLTDPVIYTGKQAITFIGNGAKIDGSNAGSFTLNDDLTAITEDGTLIFKTASDVTIKNLAINNSATRGIVVNIPADATGEDINVNLAKVTVHGSALYGLHIDDNANEFDDGSSGSAIGINIDIFNSSFTANGTGAIDFDGVRVDERSEGSINALIVRTHIDGNGGDGIELDEAGSGDVQATAIKTSFDNNGFYNAEDLDDGFDIDEADDGDIEVNLFNVSVSHNLDEGLDFDESGKGEIDAILYKVTASNNTDEGIKFDEEENGDIEITANKIRSLHNGDDGIQLTEVGQGKIEAKLNRTIASHNAKFGIKMEQWVIEDDEALTEDAGTLFVKRTVLQGNGAGDEIQLHNITTR